MLQSVNVLPAINALSHPFPENDLDKENAQLLKGLLLELSNQESYSEFRSILRNAANAIREKAFGYNRKTTKNKIIKLLNEFTCCEIIDFVEETGINDKEIQEALKELVEEKIIREGNRRRWQEAGKHYNKIYELI